MEPSTNTQLNTQLGPISLHGHKGCPRIGECIVSRTAQDMFLEDGERPEYGIVFYFKDNCIEGGNNCKGLMGGI